jgi:hypothetical protein
MEILKKINPPNKLNYGDYGTIWEVCENGIDKTYYVQMSHDEGVMSWMSISEILEAVWFESLKGHNPMDILEPLLIEYNKIQK